MSNVGIMLCGSAIDWQSDFLAEIVGISGLGGTRPYVENAKNSDNGDFCGIIVSCIARGTPMRCIIVFSPKLDWKTEIGRAHV